MTSRKVIAEVADIEEGQLCPLGHRIGQKFIFDEKGPDKRLCKVAIKSLLPAVNSLLKGKKFPWYVEGEDFFWGCNHPGDIREGLGRMVFKLTLIKK